jgi:uncharacterized phage protein (TIGR01671 family)
MFNQKLRLWNTEAKTMIYPKEPVEIELTGNISIDSKIDFAISLDGHILMRDDDFFSDAYRMLNDEYAKRFIKMRSIGLVDKNGKDIYEGDIVQYFACRRYVFWNHIMPGWRFTVQSNNDFHIEDNTPNTDEQTHIKIIGNIYENQELLEE